MSIIRSAIFKKRNFTVMYNTVQLIKNASSDIQHIAIHRLSFHPVRLCSTISPSITIDNKYCATASDKLEKTKKLHCTLDENFTLEDLIKPDLELIAERFGLKGLSIPCIQKYNMRISPDFTTLLFPFDSLEKEISAIQTMTFDEKSFEENVSIHFSSSLDEPVLFGWSLVDPSEKILVITSDPLDAIAVNQISNVAAVSLPHNFSKFSSEVLAVLKEFNKIIFWMRPYLHDWELHKFLGKTLKDNGYFIWPNEYNNPITCLQNGPHIKQILKDAYPLNDNRLETFYSYKDIIYEECKNEEKISGIKWKRFIPLNDLLKGHRKGELTVFTGQTGTGKTTFMSEYSLDLCIQGLPTLWASFEITYARLMKTMLCQYSKCSLDEIIPEYEDWSNKFEKIPMFVLNFHTCHSLEGILSAMLSAIRLYNIQHIVIDNLQFMMNMDDYNSNVDQLRRQDQIFAAFREFATHWKCHITLVIHPRKEPEFSELNITSISGTAKATQEADNVIILQTTKSRQYIQVTKNRFDGHKGCVLLQYDRKTFSYTMKKMSTKVESSEEKTSVL